MRLFSEPRARLMLTARFQVAVRVSGKLWLFRRSIHRRRCPITRNRCCRSWLGPASRWPTLEADMVATRTVLSVAVSGRIVLCPPTTKVNVPLSGPTRTTLTVTSARASAFGLGRREVGANGVGNGEADLGRIVGQGQTSSVEVWVTTTFGSSEFGSTMASALRCQHSPVDEC